MALPRTPVMRMALLAVATTLQGGCASTGEPGSGGHGGAAVAGSGFGGASGDAGHVTGAAGAPVVAGAGGSSAGASAGGSGANAGGRANGAGSGGSPAGGTSGTGALAGGAGSLTGGRGGAAGQASSAGSSAAGGAGASAGAAGGSPKILLVAGTGTGGDGTPATSAAVLNPYGTVVDPVTGDLYIAEVDTGKIRHIDDSGVITTVIGPGAPGDAASIVLNQPHDLLFQPGTRILFVADTMNGNVYRLDAASGDVALFVGAGAAFPNVTRVYCLAFSPSGGDLYYTTPNDVRVIDLGTTTQKPAVPYADARVIAVDSQGNLYAVKNRPNGDALEAVDAAGERTTMPATLNVVSDPKHIAVDGDDNVLIADTELFLVRRYVVATDSLVTLVGNGVSGTGMLGGDPLKAQLKRPHGIFEDKKTGVIYISDSENNRVLKLVNQ